MSDAVIVALITAGASVLVQIVIANVQSRDLIAKMEAESKLSDTNLQARIDQFQAVTNEKIAELSDRVDKHNSMVERTYQLERDMARHDEQIKTLFKTAGQKQ
jgi:hypothetical protein